MVDFLLQILKDIPAHLAVLILAMAPVVELRAALPVGLAVYKLPLWQVMPIVLLGNMIPAFFIIYFWDWIIDNTKKHIPWLNNILSRFHERVKGKSAQKVNLYGPLALILFVAIPLPGSGVWTGALIAWLFELPKLRSMAAIFVGVLLAAIAVSIVTYTGLSYV